MLDVPDVRTFAARTVSNVRADGVAPALSRAALEVRAFARRLGRGPQSGRLIWDAEWDICCVVDACRFDAWQEVYPDHEWLGTGQAWSVGSASPEWYGRTFAPGALPSDRIGVVTANPFSAKPAARAPGAPPGSLPLSSHDLAVLDEVWQDVWGVETGEGYIDVTPPTAVTDRAWRAWTNDDLDRLVIHYMQPHIPFRSRPEWFDQRVDLEYFGEPEKERGKDPWKCVRDGEIGRDAWWAAYCDNLQWVLEDINRLRRAVDADLLITSDHGNGLGERGVWSHPPGIDTAVLRRVPWVHVEGLGRGGFEPAGDGAAESVDATTEEQLEALGYA